MNLSPTGHDQHWSGSSQLTLILQKNSSRSSCLAPHLSVSLEWPISVSHWENKVGTIKLSWVRSECYKGLLQVGAKVHRKTHEPISHSLFGCSKRKSTWAKVLWMQVAHTKWYAEVKYSCRPCYQWLPRLSKQAMNFLNPETLFHAPKEVTFGEGRKKEKKSSSSITLWLLIPCAEVQNHFSCTKTKILFPDVTETTKNNSSLSPAKKKKLTLSQTIPAFQLTVWWQIAKKAGIQKLASPLQTMGQVHLLRGMPH